MGYQWQEVRVHDAHISSSPVMGSDGIQDVIVARPIEKMDPGNDRLAGCRCRWCRLRDEVMVVDLCRAVAVPEATRHDIEAAIQVHHPHSNLHIGSTGFLQ